MEDDDVDDLENLFEGDENEEPPKESADNQTNGETSESVRVPVPKRIVRNPRLKFNAERLCGERGIPVVVDYFKNMKFKGKGYEKEDLCKLLATLEHWTHRLFPSMKFHDSLRQIEKLGKKRLVQTCLRKIRLDMPILSSDFIHDDDNDEVERIADNESAPNDAFDSLLENTLEISSPVATDHPVLTVPPIVTTPITNLPEPGSNILGSSFGSCLTDEQRKRMDYNRMLAAERRKAKLLCSDTVHEASCSDSRNLDNCNDSNSMSNEADNLTDEIKTVEKPNLSELSENENSERLKLDELMDLIEDDESDVPFEDPQSSTNVNDFQLNDMTGTNAIIPSHLGHCLKDDYVGCTANNTPIKLCLNQLLDEVEKNECVLGGNSPILSDADCMDTTST